jgi:hypothetical protein
MRRVWENPDEARARGLAARDELLAGFTVERTAEFFSRRLAELGTRGSLSTRAPRRGARESILEASDLLRADIGHSLAVGGSGITLRARALLRRALWPYLERERGLDTATLSALVALQRSVEDLEGRLRSLERRQGQSPVDENERRSTSA